MEIDYYAVLGVDTDADAASIRDSYKRLALMYHPDKVSAAEREEAEMRFKTISEAYETLINEENRMLYDAGTQFGGFDWHDYYQHQDDSSSFSQTHSRRHSFNTTTTTFNTYQPATKSDRTPDVDITVQISLEDVYFGENVQLRTSRDVLCRKCNGSGAKKGARKWKCAECRGRGERVQPTQVAPGVWRKESSICRHCSGEGRVYRKTSLCTRCDGCKMQNLDSVIDIYIPPGVHSNHRICVENQADEEIGKTTGDLVVTVVVEDDPRFNRSGSDLYTDARISLKDALTGFSKVLVEHFDKRKIRVDVPRGTIVRPGAIIKVPGEGLPQPDSHLDPALSGDMYVYLHIDFPQSLPSTALADIAALLSSKQDSTASRPSKDAGSPEDCVCAPYEIITERDLPAMEEQANPDVLVDFDYEAFA